jgi:hypothetical protein
VAFGDGSYLLVVVVDRGIGKLALEIGDFGFGPTEVALEPFDPLAQILVASWRRVRSSAEVTRRRSSFAGCSPTSAVVVERRPLKTSSSTPGNKRADLRARR